MFDHPGSWFAGTPEAENCKNTGHLVGTELVVSGIPADDADGGLNVRSRPALEATAVHTLPNGSAVELIGTCQVNRDGFRWWRVLYRDQGGGAGWVASEFLQPE